MNVALTGVCDLIHTQRRRQSSVEINTHLASPLQFTSLQCNTNNSRPIPTRQPAPNAGMHAHYQSGHFTDKAKQATPLTRHGQRTKQHCPIGSLSLSWHLAAAALVGTWLP